MGQCGTSAAGETLEFSQAVQQERNNPGAGEKMGAEAGGLEHGTPGGECPWLLNPWTATLIKLPLAVALFWKLRCGLQNENASGLWVREDLFPVAYNLVHLN